MRQIRAKMNRISIAYWGEIIATNHRPLGSAQQKPCLESGMVLVDIDYRNVGELLAWMMGDQSSVRQAFEQVPPTCSD